ncbi:unnamed protein product [Linum tenue]|uniref:Uncharacterized protein n=1 Tax=Linum tenue TaxID=586396 RepID=A0AAV0J8S2_9ROSI|nr:unnamed protein product [Linum tenue]
MEATWVSKFPLSSAALTNYPPPFTASLPISRRTLFRSSESRHWVSYGIHSVTHYPFPKLTRRLFLPSVSGIWDAITGGDKAREAVLAVRRGMLLFRQGDVVGSLAEFDKAIELDPRQKAYMWQRGLSLYYLDRFEEGAEQFRLDVAMNPNDTEESIWCFLCEAQLFGVHEARKRFLEFAAAFSNGRENEYFYASLYTGLYHECQKEADSAKFHLVAACKSVYGKKSDDYMASLAKVHCQCRNWSID